MAEGWNCMSAVEMIVWSVSQTDMFPVSTCALSHVKITENQPKVPMMLGDLYTLYGTCFWNCFKTNNLVYSSLVIWI